MLYLHWSWNYCQFVQKLRSHSPKSSSVRGRVSILSGHHTLCLTDRPFQTNKVSKRPLRRICICSETSRRTRCEWCATSMMSDKSCTSLSKDHVRWPTTPHTATDGFTFCTDAAPAIPLYPHNQWGYFSTNHFDFCNSCSVCPPANLEIKTHWNSAHCLHCYPFSFTALRNIYNGSLHIKCRLTYWSITKISPQKTKRQKITCCSTQ